ncbi:MAG: S8 family serine peptidase [Candidatus Coatesbacteria bacterium]|nr:S8 family serine peptidase [Candidatus Coatesbacteria bacterium]
MRSTVVVLALLVALITCASAVGFCESVQKLDVLLRPLLRTPTPEPARMQGLLKAHGIAFSMEAAELHVGLVLKATDESRASALAAEVQRLGGAVGSVFGSFVTARLPVSALASLERVDSLRFAEAARVLRPSLDRSVPASKGDLANWGVNLSHGYDGSGVVVGDVDSGIDWTHLDFRSADGGTRLISLWDQTLSGDPPAGFSYGTELTRDEINAELAAGDPPIWTPGLDEEGHGTHVMSIVASNGRCGAGFSGVAPAASIVFTKVSFSSDFGTDRVLDGVNYIFQKAESLGLPAVVNLSLGYNVGSHDGTSLACQAIDALTGPGKVIVNSAGNSAYYEDYNGDRYYTHVGFEATADEQKFGAYISYYSDEGVIEMWYEPPGSVEVAIGAIDTWYGGDVRHGQFVGPGDSLADESLTDDGSEIARYDIDATETSDPNNGARHVVIRIWPEYWSSLIYNWAVTVKGDCYFDAWAGEDGYALFVGEQSGIVGGDSRSSLTYPAYAKQVIAVGSYVTKNEWYDIYGQRRSDPSAAVGAISSFSSRGPSRRPDLTGPKPEIAAPGQYVAGAFSAQTRAMGEYYYYPAYVVHDYYYYISAGTSMSSPHVAGAVGLLLQCNPDLTPDDIEQILAQSARSDAFTGAVHNDTYGYGKLDVQAALRVVDPGGSNTLGLDVQANYPVYGRVGTLEIYAQAASVGPGTSINFGMAVLRPDGALLFFPFWSSDYTMMNLYLPADFYVRDLLVHSCPIQPGSAPLSTAGSYVVYAAFADPSTGAILGDLSIATFEVDM